MTSIEDILKNASLEDLKFIRLQLANEITNKDNRRKQQTLINKTINIAPANTTDDVLITGKNGIVWRKVGDINQKDPNEYVLYVLLRDMNINAGRYLAYVTTDVIEQVNKKVSQGLFLRWLPRQNVVYLHAKGYKDIKYAIQQCSRGGIPFNHIFIPTRQQKPKTQSVLGVVIGPVQRKKICNLTNRYKLY